MSIIFSFKKNSAKWSRRKGKSKHANPRPRKSMATRLISSNHTIRRPQGVYLEALAVSGGWEEPLSSLRGSSLGAALLAPPGSGLATGGLGARA
jgi:hypothetical protein